MPQLRVLHVIGKMDRGGAETLLMNLYRVIDRSRVQFDFLVHSPEKGDYDDEIEALGGTIYHLIPFAAGNLPRYRSACRTFFESIGGSIQSYTGILEAALQFTLARRSALGVCASLTVMPRRAHFPQQSLSSECFRIRRETSPITLLHALSRRGSIDMAKRWSRVISSAS